MTSKRLSTYALTSFQTRALAAEHSAEWLSKLHASETYITSPTTRIDRKDVGRGSISEIPALSPSPDYPTVQRNENLPGNDPVVNLAIDGTEFGKEKPWQLEESPSRAAVARVIPHWASTIVSSLRQRRTNLDYRLMHILSGKHRFRWTYSSYCIDMSIL